MSNLDDVIKDILGNMFYDRSKTIAEQKDVLPLFEDDQTSWLNNYKFPQNSVYATARNIGQTNIIKYPTCVPNVKITLPSVAKDSIQPVEWVNKTEPYDVTKATEFFGAACKFYGSEPQSTVVQPEDQVFFNPETYEFCQPIFFDEKPSIFFSLFGKNKEPLFKKQGISKDQLAKSYLQRTKVEGKKWNQLISSGNYIGKIYYANFPTEEEAKEKNFTNGTGNFAIPITKDGQRVTRRVTLDYTYSKGCVRVTQDQCMRLSWERLHSYSGGGLKKFKDTIAGKEWCACTGKVIDKSMITDEIKIKHKNKGLSVFSQADIQATEEVKYPWDVRYRGYKDCSKSSECISDMEKVVDQLVLKFPGTDKTIIGHMNPPRFKDGQTTKFEQMLGLEAPDESKINWKLQPPFQTNYTGFMQTPNFMPGGLGQMIEQGKKIELTSPPIVAGT
jgi:hypothetical protein